MTLAIPMVGLKCGRLTVLSRDEAAVGRAKWVCQCECGKSLSVDGRYLRDGRTVSCGCYVRERHTKHGLSRSRTYRIWQNMKDRCKSHVGAKALNYQERGIRVTERWMNFEAFFADMGEAPSGMSIDRISNSGNYEPGNCQWATPTTQQNNTRANVFLEHNGERLTVSQWAKKLGVSRGRIAYRVSKGLSPSTVLS